MRTLQLFSIALLLTGACTLKPCIDKQCSPTSGTLTGDLRQDLLGQWVTPANLQELRADGTGRSVVLCDVGNSYTTPGNRYDFTWRLEGRQLRYSDNDAGVEVISASAEQLVLRQAADARQAAIDTTWQRSTCQGPAFE